MTTTVKITPSSHDVTVQQINPHTGDEGAATIKLAADSGEFTMYAHQGNYLVIKEVAEDNTKDFNDD